MEDLANGRPHIDCHPSFVFLFSNLRVDPLQFREAVSSLRSDTGPEDELDESCGGVVEDEVRPELVDYPGTTRGTKLSVLRKIVFFPLVNRSF